MPRPHLPGLHADLACLLPTNPTTLPTCRLPCVVIVLRIPDSDQQAVSTRQILVVYEECRDSHLQKRMVHRYTISTKLYTPTPIPNPYT